MNTAGKQELLKREILDEAEKRAKIIRQRAERDAKKTMSEAESKAAALTKEVLDRAEADAKREAHRIREAVPLEKTRRKLRAQEDVIQDVLGRATERIRMLSGGERIGFLARLMADAARAIREDEILIEMAEDDRGLFDAAVEQAQAALAESGSSVQFRLVGARDPLTGGLLARSADGHKLVDHSLEARRRRVEPHLRLKLAEMLFADSPDAVSSA